MGVPTPNTSSESSTPPPGNLAYTDRCVRIKSSSVTVGGFDIDDPRMQRAFQNQLIRHEVMKVGDLVEKYAALAADDKVQDSDKILFSTLGTWLRADLAKAIAAVADVSNRPDDN
ncbi:uncharacterized protein N0V89_008598 [Didymosphaeria variabile]|uniref:Uncharacterized protein n=1 Tax=Didymosphaeria variabile TaxID=1932322 RepID=A0A9W8XH20_9PLEO|nr:uncharacterized protein N0V89_008598 [Didymosphaeria variabile]KAJ4349977.1 hypothetical protein N0V89_008598 [Didymosphaeria variabile]